MDVHKLEQLLIDEVSGVDDPANQVPGWLVMKNRRDPGLLRALDDAITVEGGEPESYLVAFEKLRQEIGDDELFVLAVRKALIKVGYRGREASTTEGSIIRHALRNRS